MTAGSIRKGFANTGNDPESLGVFPCSDSCHRKVIVNMKLKYRDWRAKWLEYIESEHWKNLKQAKFTESGKVCFNCGCSKRIECHHIRYLNFLDCTPTDLMTLCKGCHDRLHAGLRHFKRQIGSVTEDNCREFLKSCVGVVPDKPKKPRLEKIRKPVSGRRKLKALRRKVRLAFGQGLHKGEGIEIVKEIIRRLQEIVDEWEHPDPMIRLMDIPAEGSIPPERIPF